MPPGSAGSRLGALARSRLEPALAVIEGRPDAIVVAREAAAVPLTALPQLGPDAREAYSLVWRADGVAPHSRFDVGNWTSLEPATR